MISGGQRRKEYNVSMRVLIADPDWSFLQQTRSYLESRGHHTVYEPDTDVVLERARHWRPDVVMLSAELDDVCDGDLVEKLSALQPRPAILLTAALDSFDKAWPVFLRQNQAID